MEKIYIINEHAGNGQGIKEFKEKIKNEKNPKIIITDYKQHAELIAEKYRDKEVIVYSVGGDGTLNEVVNGLAYGKALLGVIKAGSGNDFIKTSSQLVKGPQIIDLGMVNDRFYINSASIGLDAEIGYNALKMKNIGIPRNQIYNSSIIYTLFNYKNKNIILNEEQKALTLLALMNGQYYGGGFQIAPFADLQDGYLDMYLANDINKLEVLKLLLKLTKAQHHFDKNVEYKKIKEIFIESDIPLICGIDGEELITNELKIKVKEKAITLYNE